MKHLASIFILIISISYSQAQYFLPELNETQILMAKETYAVTNDGDTVKGRVVAQTLINGQLRSFTIKKSDKSKAKFTAADVQLLAVKPTKLANIESAMSVQSIIRASNIDFDEVMNREWVYFERALLPRRKDKPALMQLLNPGFDNKIKVYFDPNANESGGLNLNGLQLTGGNDLSYLVVYDGNKSEIYRRGNYRRDALSELYKDCDVFVENYQGEKFRWENFAEHVFVYDQLCE
ncbi:MAG: hypothetical protein RIA69_02355 [Cyclobacteriaceae bacterium]